MEKKKRHRPTYTFSDMVRVWKAAQLNSKMTGMDFLNLVEGHRGDGDEHVSPTDLAQPHVYREGFISLESFATFKTLFASMLPGLTKKNLKQILRDLRTKAPEFRRRKADKMYDWTFNVHPHRYYDKWERQAARHSLIPGRIFLDREYAYKSILKAYCKRISKDGTLRNLLRELENRVTANVLANGYVDSDPNQAKNGAPRYIRKDANELLPDKLKGMVRAAIFEHWVSVDDVDSNPTIQSVNIRANDHNWEQFWVTPYKDKNGRGGLMLCFKCQHSGQSKVWSDKLESTLNGTASWWIHVPTVILDRSASMVVSRPDIIEDWDAFVAKEVERD